MRPGGAGNRKVGKAGRMAKATRQIGELSGGLRNLGVQRQHPIAVEVQDQFQPLVELTGPADGTLPLELARSVRELGMVTADKKSRSAYRSSQWTSAAMPWPASWCLGPMRPRCLCC